MCRRRLRLLPGFEAVVLTVALVLLAGTPGRAEDLAARRLRLKAELSSALDAQDDYLSVGPHGPGWKAWLETEELRAQLASPAGPDLITLYEHDSRYHERLPVLWHPPISRVRGSLAGLLQNSPEPTAGELAARITETASATPLPPLPLDAQHLQLEAALAALDRHLAGLARPGADWRTYLELDALHAELQRGTEARLEVLEEALGRFTAGHAGLERSQLAAVRVALADYCRSLRAFNLPDRELQVRSQLARLAKYLERAEARRRGNPQRDIGECLAWLDRHGVRTAEMRAVERRFLRPNVYVQIADEVFLSRFERQLSEQIPLRESSGGAVITGQGHLAGRVAMQLVPNDSVAAFRMQFTGTLDTSLDGRSGPVGFSGHGRTQLTGETQLIADGEVVRALPTQTHADTQLAIDGVWSSFRGPLRDRIARRIGWQRLVESRPGSEQRTSRKAADDLRRRFTEEGTRLVAGMNEQLARDLRAPLTKERIYPRDVRLSTTAAHLCMQGTLASPAQLAADSWPPAFDDTAALCLAMHESAVNNLCNTTLADRTIQSHELSGVLDQVLGESPQGFENVAGVPWSLTAAPADPLEVDVAADGVKITVRCVKITAGAEEMNIPLAVSARYRLQLDGDAVLMQRQGPLEFRGPGIAFGDRNAELTDSETAVIERFEMLFQEQLRFTMAQLPIDRKLTENFVPKSLDYGDGWVVLSFDYREGAPVQPPASTTTAAVR
ncbi:MAG: hypothetical protein K1X74_09395 [Pirellulales bacterium]|nr:hypothetical protein [Pirellulales bacterium]